MDGDVAPLPELVRLARAHDATLIVDDAHATGHFGRGRRGLSAGADIVIGTFSKALGGFGAYVACSSDDAGLSRQSLQRLHLLDGAAAAGARRHRRRARPAARSRRRAAQRGEALPRSSAPPLKSRVTTQAHRRPRSCR